MRFQNPMLLGPRSPPPTAFRVANRMPQATCSVDNSTSACTTAFQPMGVANGCGAAFEASAMCSSFRGLRNVQECVMSHVCDVMPRPAGAGASAHGRRPRRRAANAPGAAHVPVAHRLRAPRSLDSALGLCGSPGHRRQTPCLLITRPARVYAFKFRTRGPAACAGTRAWGSTRARRCPGCAWSWRR